MPPALIFVPLTDPQAEYWIRACWVYCVRSGYTPHSVVHNWSDILNMIVDGLAAVVVVGRREHLDPNRLPRLEVITEDLKGEEKPERRRPRRRGRRWEAPR